MAYDRKQGGHEIAQANRPDYRLEVGQAEVPVGVARGFVILDAARAATLKAWCATLIPAGAGRPDAGDVGAAEYIDATVSKVPSLRPALLHALDAVDRIAQSKTHQPFADCTGLRAGDPIDLFVELVNFVANKRGGVRAGSFVTTGTHTGLVFTEPGVTIRAEYGPLGRVEVSFPPGTHVAYETGAHEPRINQQVWVLEGEIVVTVGDDSHRLADGDCLAMLLDQCTDLRT